MPMVKKETEISLLNWHLGVGLRLGAAKCTLMGRWKIPAYSLSFKGKCNLVLEKKHLNDKICSSF